MAGTFSPTRYKVSTITATASISKRSNELLINFQQLYDLIDLQDDVDENGFTYVEYGVKKGDVYHKGFHKKLNIQRRKKRDGKRFDNQITLLIRLVKNSADGKKLEQPFVTNMKIFKNGNVQMTGLKSIEQGMLALEFVVQYLQENPKIEGVFENGCSQWLAPDNYDIRLINSDFYVGFEVKRDKLFRLMQSNSNAFSTYEPCIYPGVKIQYDASCNPSDEFHTNLCLKGKRITIAVFQSGSVIITGAKSYEQVDMAYDFICGILKKHECELKHVCLAEVAE